MPRAPGAQYRLELSGAPVGCPACSAGTGRPACGHDQSRQHHRGRRYCCDCRRAPAIGALADQLLPLLDRRTNDGPVLAFRVHHFQPAEYDGRVTTKAAITGRGGDHATGWPAADPSISGAPTVEQLAGQRAGRGGEGGPFRVLSDWATRRWTTELTPAQPFLYRVRRPATADKVEAPAGCGARLQVALQGNVEWTRFTTLP